MKTNRAFWDTSAIVPLCCRQDASANFRRLRRQMPDVAAWWGATVEARSALARLLKEGKLTAKGIQQAIARLEAQRAAWFEILPSAKIQSLAEAMPEQFGLRALDSFQLAAALAWCRERTRGRVFICGDILLAQAAAKAGFSVLP